MQKPLFEGDKAILDPKRGIMLTWKGKLIIWFYKHAPHVSDRLIHWEMSKEVDSPF